MNMNKPFWRTLPYRFSHKGGSTYSVQDRDYKFICEMSVSTRTAKSLDRDWGGGSFYLYSDRTNPENDPHYVLGKLEYLMKQELVKESEDG